MFATVLLLAYLPVHSGRTPGSVTVSRSAHCTMKRILTSCSRSPRIAIERCRETSGCDPEGVNVIQMPMLSCENFSKRGNVFLTHGFMLTNWRHMMEDEGRLHSDCALTFASLWTTRKWVTSTFWKEEVVMRQLARAKSRQELPTLRASAKFTWIWRWSMIRWSDPLDC